MVMLPGTVKLAFSAGLVIETMGGLFALLEVNAAACKVTLPLIYAMENGHREARELVARVLAGKEFDSVRPETIVSLVQDSGALDRARRLAHDCAQRAKACLNGHRDSEYARALATLPDFILEREN